MSNTIETEPPIECPSTNPYAFKQGRNCCKTKKEDDHHMKKKRRSDLSPRHPHYDSSCDGGDLSITSNCCENGAVVVCPDGKLCIDRNENGGNKCFCYQIYHFLFDSII